MDFTIVSLGNVEFLSNVLNGVAMISGTGSYTKLVMVGFGLGLLLIGFQCLFEGAQKINLHHLLICMICYMCLFGPHCRVIIEDAYTGEARTVDNLPLGVGVAGTAISTIGLGLTKLIETGYSDADRTTEHAFAENLHILSSLRTVFANDGLFKVIDKELGNRQNGQPSNSKQALINYLSECTMPKIQLGGTSAERLRTASWASGEFKLDSEAHYVLLPIGGTGGGVNKNDMFSCKAGYTHLEKIFAKLGSSQVKQAINAHLKIKNADGTIPMNNNKVTSAIQDLSSMVADTQDFMRILIVDGVYPEAAGKFYDSALSRAASTAVKQAVLQRNTQWASEAPMFVNASRAIMAFFEGFIYAIVPIMGFLIALGAFGLKLVSKFFLVLIWIQLWLPILAISNLYTNTAVRAALRTINGNEFQTMDALQKIWAETDTWIATGGMLAGATPIISLFLITGSTYAFTTLASRLNGRDHFNERMIAPDVANAPALMSAQSSYTADPTSGTYRTGAMQYTPTLNLSKVSSEALTHAEGVTRSATRQYASSIADSYTRGQVSSEMRSEVQSIGKSFMQSLSSTDKAAYDEIQSYGRNHGLTEQELHERTGLAVASISAGVDAKAGVSTSMLGKAAESFGQLKDMVGRSAGKAVSRGMTKLEGDKESESPLNLGAGVNIKGDIRGAAQSGDKLANGTTFSRSAGDTDSATLNSTRSAGIQQAATNAIQDAVNKSHNTTATGSHAKSHTAGFSQVETAMQNEMRARSMNSSGGLSQSVNLITAAERLMASSPKAAENLAQYGTRLSGEARTKYADRVRDLTSDATAGNEMKAKVIAAMQFMAEGNDKGERLELANALSSNPTMMNASSLASGESSVNTGNGIRSEVNSNLSKVRNDVAQGQQGVAAQKAGFKNVDENARSVHTRQSKQQFYTDKARNNAIHIENGNRVNADFAGNAYMAIQKDPAGGTGLWISQWTDRSVADMAKGLVSSGTPRNVDRTELTYAQNNLVNAMQTGDQAEIQSALKSVHNEIREAFYGDKAYDKLSDSEKESVNNSTAGVVNHLHGMVSDDNYQAKGNTLKNFNYAFLPGKTHDFHQNNLYGSTGQQMVEGVIPPTPQQNAQR